MSSETADQLYGSPSVRADQTKFVYSISSQQPQHASSHPHGPYILSLQPVAIQYYLQRCYNDHRSRQSHVLCCPQQSVSSPLPVLDKNWHSINQVSAVKKIKKLNKLQNAVTAQVLVHIRNNWRISYLSSPLPPSAPWVCQGNLCLLCSEMVCQRILVHLRQCACHISNQIMSKQIYYTFYRGSSWHTGCPGLITELQISLMLPRADQRKSTCKKLHLADQHWLSGYDPLNL